ncbi:chemotaxis protein CheX [Pelosinus sp. sgz500959]|uniref:chemotaxis protein CheX n=1 Tax=Pelosinus sp. sgz500959 TaxID=3242472 RepID=UPI00366B8FDE
MSEGNYIELWIHALLKNIQTMAEIEGKPRQTVAQPTVFVSRGLAVIIGITGLRPGRIILDSDMETARQLSEIFNGETYLEEDDIIDSIAEFANIVSGHGITQINNLEKNLALLLTPPSVFLGKKINITSPKINAEVIEIDTSVGSIKISVGFEGGY